MEVAPANVRAGPRGWFARWGLPDARRLDNGFPRGAFSDLPPALALWRLGLGLDLVWNPPGHKQANAVSERAHGVCQRWVEPRARLDSVTTLHRERAPHRDAPNRVAAYPALAAGGRPSDPAAEATRWDERRGWTVRAERVVTRRVAKVGRIALANRPLGVGRAWAGQPVTVRWAIADDTPVWRIRDGQGTLLRQHPDPKLSRERIQARDVSPRRPQRRRRGKPRARHGGEPYTR
jgi:hypothetical protein